METIMKFIVIIFALVQLLISCSSEHYDIVIKNGTVVDGSGNKGYVSDIGIKDGKVIVIEKTISVGASLEIDATGQVVAPGFIDVLSWASGPIIYDGEVQSVVCQGITTAIFGEGLSMGPVNDAVQEDMQTMWKEYNISYDWRTLADYLKYVEKQGTSVNIASFVGATTVRLYVIGNEDRLATPEELKKMQELIRIEMEAGALGVASSLVYTPAFYANTEELIELSKTAAEYGGIYISHIRGEGADLIEALEELITITEQAKIPAEVYHLKAAGKENWQKLDDAISLIEKARERGLDITADIYPYTAGATGLDAMLPPWSKEGGNEEMIKRLKQKSTRDKIKKEILTSTSGWENFYWMAGGGKGILVSYLAKNKEFQGKSIAKIASIVNKDELDTIFDLLIDENGFGGGIYFLMSEDNVMKKLQLPWVSFCTDEDAYKLTGLMSKRNPHPRAYGTFPRILGKYVREEGVIALEEAIRKMSGLPADRLGLKDRGRIGKGLAADIVVFNPKTVIDKATYTEPHQFPEGIHYVIVNGKIVVKDGVHTGAKPGKALFKTIN
jgi:N-acyl-D-amino-acid deacylase